MIIKCPKCETNFEIPNNKTEEIKKFRCSVCKFIWRKNSQVSKENIEKIEKENKKQHENVEISIFKLIFLIVFIMIFIFTIILLSNKQFNQNVRRYVYSIKSPTDNLEIIINRPVEFATLNDDKIILVKGIVKNKSSFNTKIPTLNLILKNDSGTIMKRQLKELPIESIGAYEEVNFEITSKMASDQVSIVEVNFIK